MIENIIVNLIGSLVVFYLGSKILHEKINYKSIRFLLFWIGLAAYMLFIYFVTANFIRIIGNFMVFTIVYSLYFHKTIFKSSIVSFVALSLLFLSESLCVLVLMLVYMNQDLSVQNFFLRIAPNLLIALFSYIMINSKKINNIIDKKIMIISNSEKRSVMIFLLFSILTLSILMYSIFFDLNKIFMLILNIVIVLIYFYIVFTIFQEKRENERLQDEYDTILKDIKGYEKMLNIQRMRNHENDNNLISIRGMIKNQNQEAVDFINSLLKDKKNDDQYLILKTKNIPTGGLQGIIYQKLLLMKQMKISYNVEISKEITTDLFSKKDTDIIKDMCTITGVFLDNAIQAVEKNKKKLVGVYLYKEKGDLLITISNNYEGKLVIENFDKVGYTTKKTGHGYGLSLVKEIIHKNKNLSNNRIINGNILTQILRVKLNKSKKI